LLSALHARKACDRGLAIVYYYLHVRAELAQQWSDDALWLFEHRAQNVFRLDLLILAPLGQLDARLDGFLASQCEFV
jgi:hypothetical protein